MTATLSPPTPAAPPAGAASPARGGSGAGGRTGPSVSPLLAEGALFALSIATAAGFCRVFLGWTHLAPMVLTAGIAHLLAAVARRRRWHPVLAAVASLVGMAVTVAVVRYRDTTTFLLPSSGTWDLAYDELSRAWSAFPTAVAPVPTEGGFLAAAMVAIWVTASLSDAIAFRLRLAFEAILPAGVLFVFCSAIGADRSRLVVTACWVMAAVVSVVALRTWRDGARSGWLAGGRRRAVASSVRTGAVLGAGALAVGLLVGPALPGAGDRPVIETKQSSGGRRVADNPFVTLRSRLSSPTTAELFRVRSDHKSYWRLNSLDTFDGTAWTLSDALRDGDDRISEGAEPPAALSEAVSQVITVGEFDSAWVPMAYRPIELSGLTGVSYNATTGAAQVARGRLSQGTTYTVVSRVPSAVTPDALRSAAVPARIDRRWTALPTAFPSRLGDLARQIALGQATPYDQAVALQQFFRNNFTYDLRVGAGSSTNALVTFLENRRGYCEQFASAFAAFARALGIPARVAVGYTSGVTTGDGAFSVQGRHAHAWPEVYFDGVGWLAFEPTPSRGNPDAETYTFVQGQQVDEAPAATTDTTLPADAETPTPDTLPPLSFNLEDFLPAGGSATTATGAGDDGGWDVPWPAVGAVTALVAFGAGWLLGVPALHRRRWSKRRNAAATANERILLSWDQARVTLAAAGVRVPASDTPQEVAARLRRTPRVDADALRTLTATVTAAAYGPGAVGADDERSAAEAGRRIAAGLAQGTPWFTRARRRANVRSLLRPLPGDPVAR